MDKKYNVVLKGVGADADAEKVMHNLAALFKCPAEQVKALLAESKPVVKAGVTQSVAQQYRAVLEGVGAACVVEPAQAVGGALDFDMPGHPAAAMPAHSSDRSSSDAAVLGKETVLFQGDVHNLTKMMRVLQGDGSVTRSRCTFDWGKERFAATKDEIASVEEQKHGLGTKLVVTLKNGTQVVLQAPNMNGLKAALFALADMPFDDSALTAPEISQAKNGTAWLAAFTPLTISVLIYLWYGDRMVYFGLLSILKIWVFKLALIYFAMRIDHLALQHQGFNTVALGITPPEQFWSYLFSRARALKQGKGYAITWCVLFGFEVFSALVTFI